MLDFGYMNEHSETEQDEDTHPGLVSKYPSKVERINEDTNIHPDRIASYPPVPSYYQTSPYSVNYSVQRFN